VIEPAVSVDRALLAFLIDAYTVDEAPTAKGTIEKRTVLRLHPDLAPVKAAVLPLSRNEKLVPEAKRVHELVQAEWMTQYDDAGAIGRRYRRQDEIGTPFCITVDFDSLDDAAVTVRERDTMAQDRVPIVKVVDYLRERL
jgi:glycyl-tRNA synthetase